MKEEKVFLQELKLLREENEKRIDITYAVMAKIERSEKLFVWKLALLLFPLSVWSIFLGIKIISPTSYFKFFLNYTLIPRLFVLTPNLLFIYVLTAGFIVSFLFATLINGGKQNEVLLPSR